MRKQGWNTTRRFLAVSVLILILVAGSCGGPYTAKRVNQPDAKLIIALKLFENGKYADAAQEYKDFLAVFAGDERGDLAQFRLAECLRLDEDYSMAAIEYRILINDYGYSEYIDDAFYLEGLCAFEQRYRSERDQSKTYEALSRINRFLQLFPDSPRKAEAEKTRKEIYEVLGRKEFDNGKLYYSGKHYVAAAIYFDKVIEMYSGTVWAARGHYYRGMIFEKKGDKDKAVFEYGEAVASGFHYDEKDDALKRMLVLTGEKKSDH